MRAIFAAAALGLVFAACGDGRDGHHGCSHSHLPKGPNGLDLYEVPGGPGFVEFAIHHEHGAMSVYFLDGERQLRPLTTPPALMLTAKGQTVEITGELGDESKRALWTFNHDLLKSEPERAVLRITDGDSVKDVELPEHHHH